MYNNKQINLKNTARFILHKICVVFVDAVVGQVAVLCLLAGQIFVVILFSGKPDQALSVNVNAQWLVGCDHNIQAKVELLPKNKKRIV